MRTCEPLLVLLCCCLAETISKTDITHQGEAETREDEVMGAAQRAETAATAYTPETCQPDIYTVLREMSALVAEQRVELRHTKTQMEAMESRLRASENKAETLETRLTDRLRASEKTVEELRVQQQEQAAAVAAVGGSVNLTGSQVEELWRDREERRVSFSAALLDIVDDTNTGPFSVATPLIYKHVITNVGNAYNPNTGRLLEGYQSMEQFSRREHRRVLDVKRFYQGCGHVVHNGSLYFHITGTYKIARFNLRTWRLLPLAVEGALFHELSYLFHNSKTYFKFAADEVGLWLIYASSVDDIIMVSRIEQRWFSTLAPINTSYSRHLAGNAFIAHAVLYVTDPDDSRITFAFDLLERKPILVQLVLRPPVLAMLSYSPRHQSVLMWDNSMVKTCSVRFSSDQCGGAWPLTGPH